jgi:hypothetical protein
MSETPAQDIVSIDPLIGTLNIKYKLSLSHGNSAISRETNPLNHNFLADNAHRAKLY